MSSVSQNVSKEEGRVSGLDEGLDLVTDEGQICKRLYRRLSRLLTNYSDKNVFKTLPFLAHGGRG